MSDTRLRVLSYNIRSLKDDPIALTAVIRCVDPDVAVIQEGPRRFRWRQRIAVFARKTNLRYAVGGLPGLGNVLLTSQRVRVHDAWEVRYPLTPGRHLRAGVFARCSVGRVSFVDPAFRVVDYQVIDTPQTRLASDHLPVVVDLAFSTGFVDSDGDSAF